jgi:uncharacterized protein (TIGR00251 family)
VGWYRTEPGGIVLSVRVTPRAGRDAIDGVKRLADGREVLAVRVRPAADRGAANEAVVTTLARAFDRPRNSVVIVAGATGRIKQVHISGDSNALATIADGWRSV